MLKLFSYRFLVALLVCTIIGSASQSYAAGNAALRFSTTSKTTNVGQAVSLSIQLVGANENIDTARAQIQFPPNLLRATGTTLSGALSSTSPGNFIDNTAGTISLGGFNIGNTVNGTINFGTINFVALANGTAQVNLLPTSRTISNGQEKINTSALNSAIITIGSAPTIPSGDGEAEFAITITSPTHPDQEAWYNPASATLAWQANGEVANYLFAFDQNAETDPTKKLSGDTRERSFDRLKEGINYFHLKAQLPDGSFTPVYNYLVRTDTSAPRRFEPYLEVGEDNALTLRYATIDEVSGIDHYELQINDQAFAVSASPTILQNLIVGQNRIVVRAFDKAGNIRDAWIEFTVNEDGSISNIKKSQAICSVGILPFQLPFCCDYPLICWLLPWLILILILGALLWRNKKSKKSQNREI